MEFGQRCGDSVDVLDYTAAAITWTLIMLGAFAFTNWFRAFSWTTGAGRVPRRFLSASEQLAKQPLHSLADTVLVAERSLLLFAFGNVYQQLFACSSSTAAALAAPYLLALCGCVAGFSFLSDTDAMHVSLTASSIRLQWSATTWTLMLGFALLILTMALLHVYLAAQYGLAFLAAYVSAFLAPLLIHAALHMVYLRRDQRRRYHLHLHHWLLFYFLAFYTRFPHPMSTLARFLCSGIFIQGAACWGMPMPFHLSSK